MSRWTSATPIPNHEPTVEQVALRYGVGGIMTIFAIAGGLALTFAWDDARHARRSRGARQR